MMCAKACKSRYPFPGTLGDKLLLLLLVKIIFVMFSFFHRVLAMEDTLVACDILV